jgi:signal transduction histidine kinase
VRLHRVRHSVGLTVARFMADGVVQRQAAFALIFGIILITLPFIVSRLDAPALVATAIVVEAAVVVAAGALPWGRWPQAAQDALPVASVVALLLLERGVSGDVAYVPALVLLPVCTLAWTSGRRGVILATACAVGVVVLPAVWVDGYFGAEAVVLRSLLLPLVAFALAVFVADAASGLRSHAEAQRALADQLRSSRDVMVGLVEAATEQAIVGTDVDGFIEVFNQGAENLSGRTADEMIGRSVLDLGVRDELDTAAREQSPTPSTIGLSGDDLRWAVLVGPAATGTAYVRDWTLVRQDGTRTVRLTVTRRMPMMGVERRGYLLVATDVTAERRSEEAKDEFLGYVSHELRTPISSVLGYLELLGLDDDNLTDEQRGYLGVIDRNSHRLLHLVEDLLLRAQVDAGRFTVRAEPMDLAEILAASVRSAAPFAASNDLTLDDSTEGSVPLDADPVRLGQMIDNLLSNALKFTPSGGRVEVRARLREDGRGAARAVLTVRDDGVGIPAAEVRHLTERFYRASTATRRRVPGVGLGLSITKAIVDAHGGELAISSIEGAGTTFTVTLPVAGAPDHGPA